jgi:U3 small nucleolar RNA-associated protein 14
VVDDFGRLYRSCGNCDSTYERHVVMDGITATSGSELAGINSDSDSDLSESEDDDDDDTEDEFDGCKIGYIKTSSLLICILTLVVISN